jgi:hypothetical protein
MFRNLFYWTKQFIYLDNYLLSTRINFFSIQEGGGIATTEWFRRRNAASSLPRLRVNRC